MLVTPDEEHVDTDPESSEPGDPSLIMDIGTVPLLPNVYSIENM